MSGQDTSIAKNQLHGAIIDFLSWLESTSSAPDFDEAKLRFKQLVSRVDPSLLATENSVKMLKALSISPESSPRKEFAFEKMKSNLETIAEELRPPAPPPTPNDAQIAFFARWLKEFSRLLEAIQLGEDESAQQIADSLKLHADLSSEIASTQSSSESTAEAFNNVKILWESSAIQLRLPQIELKEFAEAVDPIFRKKNRPSSATPPLSPTPLPVVAPLSLVSPTSSPSPPAPEALRRMASHSSVSSAQKDIDFLKKMNDSLLQPGSADIFASFGAKDLEKVRSRDPDLDEFRLNQHILISGVNRGSLLFAEGDGGQVAGAGSFVAPSKEANEPNVFNSSALQTKSEDSIHFSGITTRQKDDREKSPPQERNSSKSTKFLDQRFLPFDLNFNGEIRTDWRRISYLLPSRTNLAFSFDRSQLYSRSREVFLLMLDAMFELEDEALSMLGFRFDFEAGKAVFTLSKGFEETIDDFVPLFLDLSQKKKEVFSFASIPLIELSPTSFNVLPALLEKFIAKQLGGYNEIESTPFEVLVRCLGGSIKWVEPQDFTNHEKGIAFARVHGELYRVARKDGRADDKLSLKTLRHTRPLSRRLLQIYGVNLMVVQW